MKVENNAKTCIVTDNQDDCTAFLMKLTHEHKTFEEKNLIVDVSRHDKISVKQVNAFLPLSKTHRKGKKSFVIVADVDYNKTSEKLTVVPTLQEAHDVIELEDVERDLGF